MAKNMNANKEFKSDTTKNQEIVALTSKVNNMFKRVQSAERARGGQNGDRCGGGKEKLWRCRNNYLQDQFSGSVARDL